MKPTVHISSSRLASLAFSAFGWSYLGLAARSVCSLGVGIVLARLLGPKPFGQLAATALVFGLANQFADAGFGSALVQARELTVKQTRFVFTLQMLIAAMMTIAAAAAAPLLASIFHDPAIERVVRATAPVFLFQSFGQVSTALLKRSLSFRVVQYAQITSYVGGYGLVAIAAASLGAGVWSLVAAQLCQALTYSAYAYASIRHSIVPCFDRSAFRLARFGMKVTAANVINWSITNLDNAIVGHGFGSVALGLYSRAFSLVCNPADGLVASCQQVLFASCSRAQTDISRLRLAYLTVTAAIAFVTLPLFWSLAACADTVVITIFGGQWAGAVPLFRPLAIAMPFYALMAMAGPILGASNRVEREIKTQGVSLVFSGVALGVAAQFSVTAVAWTVLVAYTFRYWVTTRPTLALLQVSWRQVLRVVGGPAAAAVATTAVVIVVKSLAKQHLTQPLLLTAVSAIAAGVAMLAVLMAAGHRILPPELITPLQRVSASLPKAVVRGLDRLEARQVVRQRVSLRPDV